MDARFGSWTGLREINLVAADLSVEPTRHLTDDRVRHFRPVQVITSAVSLNWIWAGRAQSPHQPGLNARDVLKFAHGALLRRSSPRISTARFSRLPANRCTTSLIGSLVSGPRCRLAAERDERPVRRSGRRDLTPNYVCCTLTGRWRGDFLAARMTESGREKPTGYVCCHGGQRIAASL